MKNQLIIFSFFFFLGFTSLRAVAQNPGDTAILYISGHVFDNITQAPVPDHQVYVSIESLQVYFELITNPEGYYDTIIIITEGTQLVTGTISTFDCNQLEMTETFTWTPNGMDVYQDFFICIETFPPDSLIVSVSGYVLREETSLPVPDHLVNVFIQVNPAINFTADVFTDTTGFYQAVFLLPEINMQGSAVITTMDCNQIPVIQNYVWDINNNQIWADFYICNNPLPCQANFSWIADSSNSLSIHFADISTGNINMWAWDFGDGTYSQESYVTHTYSESGSYNVCLSVFDSDSGMIICSDTTCEVITLESQLLAFYMAYLDTLGGQTNTHYFEDFSQGNPHEWYWDFGDDTFSTSQNPTHQFAYPGVFNVCLSVSRINQNGTYETNVYCNEIHSPAYYNMGGAAYAGDYPLNNPYPEGDTGIAVLYRIYPNQLFAVDTNIFTDYGYYWFTGVMEGDYIVKVQLTNLSTHYANYLPTYLGNELMWANSEILQLRDSSNYLVNLNLRKTVVLDVGVGQINGYVSPAWASGLLPPNNEGISVIVENIDHEPVAYRVTDENGFFDFNDLPFGTYYLYAETAGSYGEVMVVSLDANNYLILNTQLLLTHSLLGVRNREYSTFNVSEVFPNPVRSEFEVEISSANSTRLSYSILSVTGNIIKSGEITNLKGSHKSIFYPNGLPNGVYILQLRNDAGENINRRFIRIE